jgi:predicted nuclease with TOPRIM domain
MNNITKRYLEIGKEMANIAKNIISIESSYIDIEKNLQVLKYEKDIIENRIIEYKNEIYHLTHEISNETQKMDRIVDYEKYICHNIKRVVIDGLLGFSVMSLMSYIYIGIVLANPIILTFLPVYLSVYAGLNIACASALFYLLTHKERKTVKNLLKQNDPITICVKIEEMRQNSIKLEKEKEMLNEKLCLAKDKIEVIEEQLGERDRKLEIEEINKERLFEAIVDLITSHELIGKDSSSLESKAEAINEGQSKQLIPFYKK